MRRLFLLLFVVSLLLVGCAPPTGAPATAAHAGYHTVPLPRADRDAHPTADE